MQELGTTITLFPCCPTTSSALLLDGSILHVSERRPTVNCNCLAQYCAYYLYFVLWFYFVLAIWSFNVIQKTSYHFVQPYRTSFFLFSHIHNIINLVISLNWNCSYSRGFIRPMCDTSVCSALQCQGGEQICPMGRSRAVAGVRYVLSEQIHFRGVLDCFSASTYSHSPLLPSPVPSISHSRAYHSHEMGGSKLDWVLLSLSMDESIFPRNVAPPIVRQKPHSTCLSRNCTCYFSTLVFSL